MKRPNRRGSVGSLIGTSLLPRRQTCVRDCFAWETLNIRPWENWTRTALEKAAHEDTRHRAELHQGAIQDDLLLQTKRWVICCLGRTQPKTFSNNTTFTEVVLRAKT